MFGLPDLSDVAELAAKIYSKKTEMKNIPQIEGAERADIDLLNQAFFAAHLVAEAESQFANAKEKFEKLLSDLKTQGSLTCSGDGHRRTFAHKYTLKQRVTCLPRSLYNVKVIGVEATFTLDHKDIPHTTITYTVQEENGRGYRVLEADLIHA